MNISIAIIDDHKLVREALCQNLCPPEYNVVLNSDSGTSFFSTLKKKFDFHIDVCILDIGLKEMNGYQVMEKIAKILPFTRVLVLSMYDNKESILEMLSLGAVGYLNKTETTFAEIRNAIKNIYYSGYYFSKTAGVQEFKHSKGHGNMLTKITVREKEFLSYCIENKSYEEIAALMHVSKYTVESFRDTLFAKFEVHSKSELLVKMFKAGIIIPT